MTERSESEPIITPTRGEGEGNPEPGVGAIGAETATSSAVVFGRDSGSGRSPAMCPTDTVKEQFLPRATPEVAAKKSEAMLDERNGYDRRPTHFETVILGGL